ncbi:MAG: proprotein convertase P-domain-containing protein, partial [Anaerolineales bacterium]|nr:proprotein convertase P-domain-containing protein [Anaerolineales bacterium]
AQYCHGPFIPIPDTGASTINDAILIKESGAIVDMDVYINTAHTWVGDLRFSLTHNGVGTTRTLIDRPGVPASPFGCLRDDISAILDDSAILPVENQCANAIPTISGTFFPNQTLSSFNGEDINGTWTLKVEDVISGSGGTFNGWCMFVEFETSGN